MSPSDSLDGPTMTTALLSALASRSPREDSGSRSSNRFDFQKNWAICKMIELHQSGVDYLLLLDYHEDIVLLDSESAPSTACYFQVKTKRTHWTLAPLLSRRKGADSKPLPSTLGRLYSNYFLKPDATKALCLVSNAPFRIRLAGGGTGESRSRIEGTELEHDEMRKVESRLGAELKKTIELEDSPPLIFEVTPISLDEHTTHTRGRVSEFLEVEFPNQAPSVGATYRTFFEEVRRRTNREGSVHSVAELAKKKGIGRSFLSGILRDIELPRSLEPLWTEASARLESEGVSSLKVRELGHFWSRYEIRRMDSTDEALQQARRSLAEAGRQIWSQLPTAPLLEICDYAIERCRTDGALGGFETTFLKAIVLMEIYENPPLSDASSESEEEE